ncbi:NAD(P)-dependent oxidoreductase [Sorangium sp. So ce269]
MSAGYVLVTGDVPLPSAHDAPEVVHLREPASEREIRDAIAGAAFYILGGPEYLSAELLAAARRLQKVVVLGTGTPSFVDLEAARALGIAVDNVPGVNAEAVGEFALGTIILSLASAFHSHQALLRGEWYQKPRRSLADTRVGLLGMGATAQALARRLRAVAPCRISYCARSPRGALEAELGLERVSISELFASSDVVSIHVDLNAQSRGLVGRELLARSNPDLVLLNFSNPKVIDAAALLHALQRGQIAFAFVDGYYHEWIHNQGAENDTLGLLRLPPSKFVATTHIAAQEMRVIEQLVLEAFKKIGVGGKRDFTQVRA